MTAEVAWDAVAAVLHARVMMTAFDDEKLITRGASLCKYKLKTTECLHVCGQPPYICSSWFSHHLRFAFTFLSIF